MSENYTCPQDGCDFGESENKTLASVRGHISAASDHDWEELKAALYAQAEDADEDGAEEEAEEGDPGEVPGPNGETGHLGGVEDDQNDDGDNTEMATQDEYEEQYQDADQPADGDNGADQSTDDGDDGAGFSVPAIGGTTLLALAAVVLVVFIAWRVLGDSGVDYEQPEEQADGDEDGETMLDVEAGSGGVDV